jgi:release factor glutamine methyltransferase
VKRRACREPVAYLTGKKEFFSLSFKVSPAVLVPRPESEHLVEAALDILGGRDQAGATARVLDLGTGCGNLAVALLVNRPDIAVDGVDRSARALEVAARNARCHGVAERIRLLEGDLYEALEQDGHRSQPGPYALIVSNPPYVARHEVAGLMDDIRLHEPMEALVDSKSPAGDGLGFYREIARRAGAFLEPGGSLVLEVGAGRADEVGGLLAAAGIAAIRTLKDYGGIERVVIGQVAGQVAGQHGPRAGTGTGPSSPGSPPPT